MPATQRQRHGADIVPSVAQSQRTELSRAEAALAAFLAEQPRGTHRVTLRFLARRDEDEFVRLVTASGDLHYPWMFLPNNPRDFQLYVARFDHVTAESLLICVRDTGSIAGVVNINTIIRGAFQNGSLGYAAFAPAAGRGYMTEGLGLIIRYAFGRLALHRLEAQIQPGNHASRRLVERLGFRNEGYSPDLLFIDGAWRGHDRWAITRDMIADAPA
jgi:ribosomal-protein-alanine N-acetyltransferase